MSMAYQTKYFVKDGGKEILVTDEFETLEDALSNAWTFSLLQKNCWSAASVWNVKSDGSQVFITEFVEGKHAF